MNKKFVILNIRLKFDKFLYYNCNVDDNTELLLALLSIINCMENGKLDFFFIFNFFERSKQRAQVTQHLLKFDIRSRHKIKFKLNFLLCTNTLKYFKCFLLLVQLYSYGSYILYTFIFLHIERMTEAILIRFVYDQSNIFYFHAKRL